MWRHTRERLGKNTRHRSLPRRMRNVVVADFEQGVPDAPLLAMNRNCEIAMILDNIGFIIGQIEMAGLIGKGIVDQRRKGSIPIVQHTNIRQSRSRCAWSCIPLKRLARRQPGRHSCRSQWAPDFLSKSTKKDSFDKFSPNGHCQISPAISWQDKFARGCNVALEDQIQTAMGALTASERRAATALLADFPFAGLATVSEFSKRASVSVQTVLRLTSKLGFGGYGEFQRALIGELKDGYKSPVSLHETLRGGAPEKSFLHALTEASLDAVRETIASLPEQEFHAICDLIGDPRRSIFLTGGRMSYTLASYLFRHLRQIRPRVYLIPESHEDWPEYLLRMNRRDVVLIFDYRRYQADMETLARRAAKDQHAQAILFTDKWISPVSKHASHIMAASVDAGTPWDTGLPIVLILEAIINQVSESDWTASRKRIENWDSLRSGSGAIPEA